MSVTFDCTLACEAAPSCTICKLTKPPIGRSVAPEMATSMCQHECPGHDQDPRAGHLWPGELERSREV